jgi:hypothetical protein
MATATNLATETVASDEDHFACMTINTTPRRINLMSEKPSVTLPATVEKIIQPAHPNEPEKAQINIQEGADALYKEIRIENTLTDERGNGVKLKPGAKVEVTVEASSSGIIPKK